MEVIFLDIDGVLNINSPSYHTSYFFPDGTIKYIEEHLTQRLNYLIKTTGASVVISSSWRGDMDDLKSQMEKAGFLYWKDVIGKTPRLKYRGDEIRDYLNNHEIEKYVVLEDEILDVCGERCQTIPEEYVVEVDSKNGLSHYDIEKAKTILYKETYEN